MDRTERLCIVMELLRSHPVASFATLQAALEVSRSTLRRALSYLSTQLNSPNSYCRERGGYHLKSPDATNNASHELPGL